MTSERRPQPPARVRLAHVEWVEQRLSHRDRLIIELVNDLRLVTTNQLDRLLFSDLSGHSQAVTRGRVINRLIAWRLLTGLSRRIGGASSGSTATTLALDSTGRRLLALWRAGDESRLRYPGVPGERTVRHTLAVAELYASLVEQCRTTGDVEISSFKTEPEAWWPNGLGNYLKPDAYLVLAGKAERHHWWCEVDLATESIPTLRRKALVYLDFWQRGQLGPSNVMPRVVFSVPSLQRRNAVARIIDSLPDPAPELFLVSVDHDTVFGLLSALRE